MNISNTPGMTNISGGKEHYVAQGKTTQGNIGQSTTGTYGTNVEKELIQAIEKANHLQKGTTECQFSIHKDTKQVMIKIVDTSTKEVVREIPSEKILDMFATMCEVNGLFVDEKR
ncbi:flagellar protein FlaG [Cellulosilyticum ruminicola]|uniref:flagellar protein FlaG n=1 Tax=Cellulosilyticum ruminicola TaxID=425254 RepID=UPI0006CF6A49|nr:flagellar protein FlaG [Cellulosilyticum ruminicola]